ncbi:MAG: hypothetical protein HY000_36325, partial [Planctomycetes bacterium]|nr:hypothetical protein [Planctomycetota bacterium]
MKQFIAKFGGHVSAVAVPLLVIGGLLLVLGIWSPQTGQELAGEEVWTCSMHPQVRLPKPGRCPICGMTLVRVSQLASEQKRMEQQAGLV